MSDNQRTGTSSTASNRGEEANYDNDSHIRGVIIQRLLNQYFKRTEDYFQNTMRSTLVNLIINDNEINSQSSQSQQECNHVCTSRNEENNDNSYYQMSQPNQMQNKENPGYKAENLSDCELSSMDGNNEEEIYIETYGNNEKENYLENFCNNETLQSSSRSEYEVYSSGSDAENTSSKNTYTKNRYEKNFQNNSQQSDNFENNSQQSDNFKYSEVGNNTCRSETIESIGSVDEVVYNAKNETLELKRKFKRGQKDQRVQWQLSSSEEELNKKQYESAKFYELQSKEQPKTFTSSSETQTKNNKKQFENEYNTSASSPDAKTTTTCTFNDSNTSSIDNSNNNSNSFDRKELTCNKRKCKPSDQYDAKNMTTKNRNKISNKRENKEAERNKELNYEKKWKLFQELYEELVNDEVNSTNENSNSNPGISGSSTLKTSSSDRLEKNISKLKRLNFFKKKKHIMEKTYCDKENSSNSTLERKINIAIQNLKDSESSDYNKSKKCLKKKKSMFKLPTKNMRKYKSSRKRNRSVLKFLKEPTNINNSSDSSSEEQWKARKHLEKRTTNKSMKYLTNEYSKEKRYNNEIREFNKSKFTRKILQERSTNINDIESDNYLLNKSSSSLSLKNKTIKSKAPIETFNEGSKLDIDYKLSRTIVNDKVMNDTILEDTDENDELPSNPYEQYMNTHDRNLELERKKGQLDLTEKHSHECRALTCDDYSKINQSLKPNETSCKQVDNFNMSIDKMLSNLGQSTSSLDSIDEVSTPVNCELKNLECVSCSTTTIKLKNAVASDSGIGISIGRSKPNIIQCQNTEQRTSEIIENTVSLCNDDWNKICTCKMELSKFPQQIMSSERSKSASSGNVNKKPKTNLRVIFKREATVIDLYNSTPEETTARIEPQEKQSINLQDTIEPSFCRRIFNRVFKCKNL